MKKGISSPKKCPIFSVHTYSDIFLHKFRLPVHINDYEKNSKTHRHHPGRKQALGKTERIKKGRGLCLRPCPRFKAPEGRTNLRHTGADFLWIYGGQLQAAEGTGSCILRSMHRSGQNDRAGKRGSVRVRQHRLPLFSKRAASLHRPYAAAGSP